MSMYIHEGVALKEYILFTTKVLDRLDARKRN